MRNPINFQLVFQGFASDLVKNLMISKGFGKDLVRNSIHFQLISQGFISDLVKNLIDF